jgi:hypothetical protein
VQGSAGTALQRPPRNAFGVRCNVEPIYPDGVPPSVTAVVDYAIAVRDRCTVGT